MSVKYRSLVIFGVLMIFVAGGIFAWQYFGGPGQEATTTNWKKYALEEITQDFRSPDFYDRRLIGIQDSGQRDVIVSSIKEGAGESKEDIRWYPKEVSFPPYSSKIFFVKYLPETGHSGGLIEFDVKNLTFVELTETGKIYQNYLNYESLVSPDGLKVASLGYKELYLLDLLVDQAQLLSRAGPSEIFYPAKEIPDFAWINDYTIQYPVFSAERIYDPPTEVRQISIETKKIEKMVRNETANWKIYENKEYGFELKYPMEFFMDDSTPLKPIGSSATGELIAQFIENQWKGRAGSTWNAVDSDKGLVDNPYIGVRVIKTLPLLSAQDWILQYGTEQQLYELSSRDRDQYLIGGVKDITRIKIGGVEGIQFSKVSEGFPGSTITILKIKKDTLLNIDRNATSLGEVSIGVYEEMLSTFKFTQ